MARIRTIKPEFWTDEKVVELSALARLLFIGLWNFADDEGRMVYSPTRIKLQILPADSADIKELLGEIRGKSLIETYIVDGIEYLQVVNFALHQKVDKRTASKCPEKPNNAQLPAESPRVVPTEWIKEGIKEGKGKEQKVNTPPASRTAPARKKSSMPENFAISEGVRAWAAEKGFDRLDEHLEAFKRKATMNGYAYANWEMALQEAIREDWAKLRGKTLGQVAAPPVSDGSIVCESCGKRTRSFTGRKCDPCWRGVFNPRVAA